MTIQIIDNISSLAGLHGIATFSINCQRNPSATIRIIEVPSYHKLAGNISSRQLVLWNGPKEATAIEVLDAIAAIVMPN